VYQGLITALVCSLALTIILETGFFLITGKRNKKDLLLVVLVNVVTNPLVVLTYWLAVLYTNLNTVIVVVALELLAVLVEGFYYRKYGQTLKRPFVFSITANALSYGAGVLIKFLLHGGL